MDENTVHAEFDDLSDPVEESPGRPDPHVSAESSVGEAAGERAISGRMYQILQREYGFGLAQIAALTGLSEQEISAIMNGQRVLPLAVLAVIAKDGLGIPPGYLGLACCACEHTGPGRPSMTPNGALASMAAMAAHRRLAGRVSDA